MTTTFTPLETSDSRLFGVRLEGSVGRADRRRLMELADKCVEKERMLLVLDFGELKTIGGAGAAVLADLQRRLGEQGGEAVFVGVGDVVGHFLAKQFEDLPLRCFADVAAAETAFFADGDGEAVPRPAVETTSGTGAGPAATTERIESSGGSGDGTLDTLLEDVSSEGADHLDERRRTADLVSSVYLSLDEAVGALGSLDNPAVFGEALGKLLHGNDIAEETLYFYRERGMYVAVDGSCRLPGDGAVARALERTGRPLGLLDLEDGELTDDETALLEELQPDLLVPVSWGGKLRGIAFLRRGRTYQEYGLREIFALELLLRLLAEGRRPTAAEPEPELRVREAAVPPDTPAETDVENEPGAKLLEAKFRLLSGLDTAQDETHFWQICVGCLEELADVRSLVCVDPAQQDAVVFTAGSARQELPGVELAGERLSAFFRALERPVEVANMPASFAPVRDALLGHDLRWIVGLNTEQKHLGAVVLDLAWYDEAVPPGKTLQALMEIVSESLARVREMERRADRELGVAETLVARHEATTGDGDRITRQIAGAMRLLAREMGLPPDQERELVLGALLRDIGQNPVLAPDTPGSVDRDHPAWESCRAHPDRGADLLAELKAPAGIRDAVRHHHECFDGRGYPLGLKGREIPLAARMVAVVERFALQAAQAPEVNGAWEVGLDGVCGDAGTTLDPDLVDLFQRAMRRDAPVLLTA